MLQRLSWIICFAFFLGNTLTAQELKWLIKIRQIVPLQSTEADVKKLFGKATRHYANIERYETKKGILTITYSTGECSSKLSNYNVPKATVVYIDFLLEKPINFKIINEDISDFEKEESSDTENESYKNKTKGIDYGVFVQNEEEDADYDKSPRFLNSLSIFPPERYSYLECENEK